MCPACISTAVLIVGSVISTGSLAAITIKNWGEKRPRPSQRERPRIMTQATLTAHKSESRKEWLASDF